MDYNLFIFTSWVHSDFMSLHPSFIEYDVLRAVAQVPAV